MSSSEKPQNEAYSEPAWNHGFASEMCIPRPPNTATESRILGTIRKNEQKQQQDANNIVYNFDSSSQPQSGNPPANQIAPQQSLTLPRVHSQLNAEAKEFVPRSQGHMPDSGSKQENSQDESFSLSVTAAEFVPRTNDGFYANADSSFPQRLPFHPGANIVMDNFSSLSIREPYDSYRFDIPAEVSGSSILSRFDNSLNVLNLNPGNMEEYLRPICEMIQNNTESTGIVNDVVERLFEQSLQEPNFRYTGARICQYLNRNLKGNPYFSGFLMLFINRCQREYSLRNELKNGSPYDQERLRGLSMFMAEVFLNVETDTEDGCGSVKQLPKILIDLVSTLLTEPSDLDVKCSCQLLKLSGALIENIVKHSPEDCVKFEEIFMQLVALQGSSELTENVKFLIGSVLKLKETDWNRSTSSPPKKSMYTYTPDVNHFKVPEPVFYNEEGPCSRVEAGLPEDDDDEDDAYVLNDEEEAAFLEWEAEKAKLLSQDAWGNSDTGYESYQIDDGSDDGDMGDEMEAAYEEFLQKQNAMPGYSPHQVTNSVEQQMPPAIVHMFHQPPPIMPHRQDFQGFPQHQQYMPPANSQHQPPHVLRPNAQQNQLPPPQQQQQQQQGQPPYPQQQQQQQQQQGQPSYPQHYSRNDRYHFHR